jgi:hypothetical protein
VSVVLAVFVSLVASPLWALAQAPKGSSVPPQPKQGGSPPPPAPSKAPAPSAAAQPAAVQAQPAPQGPISSDDDPRVKAAIARAVAWYRTKEPRMATGELSLAIHALAKIRSKYADLVPPNDPYLDTLVEALRARCQGTFVPSRSSGPDNYEAGCAAMALSAVDGQLYRPEVEVVAKYLMGKQNSAGAWHYAGNQTGGDTSQTQYAILGLWEAADGAGVPVPRSVFDRAAQFLVSTQDPSGGFSYHPLSRKDPTHNMTVGSLGSLYICRDHLPGGKRKNTRGVLLQVQETEEKVDDSPVQTTPDQIKAAIERATAWATENFTMERPRGESDTGGGRFHLYFLYALERWATLANLKEIAGLDWYAEGAKILLAKQDRDGGWKGGDGDVVQTSFACLFLIRSTHRSRLQHERRLGRGTLISGKGLPSNLQELEQEGGRLRQRAIRNKTTELLTMIETGTQVEGAARGLLAEMYTKKWSAAGEEGDRLRKILQKGMREKKSEEIIVALRLLAVTGDYRVTPLLIDAMYYEEDEEVQLAARDALCLLSRRFPGSYKGSTVEDWQKEIDAWKAWYLTVRPEAELEDEIELN